MVIEYKYSIIIPHRNTPDLLQTCLNSIPRRDDIQIIVVDDKSDTDKVDFYNFPGLNDPSVEVYFLNEWKGAGHARNVGMEHAKGKWLLFADADDYFSDLFPIALDLFQEDKNEVIFFKISSVNLQTRMPSMRGEFYNSLIDMALKHGNYDKLLFYSSPCSKFYNSSFIKSNNISFQEVYIADDVMFSTMVGAKTKSFIASDLPIYCVSERNGSLTKNKSIEAALERLDADLQATLFLKDIGKDHIVRHWVYLTWLNVYRIDIMKAVIVMPGVYSVIGFTFIEYIFKSLIEVIKHYYKKLLMKIKLQYPEMWTILKKVKYLFKKIR